MNIALIAIAMLLVLPALYFLLTRRTQIGSGGGREENTTDSPNDRPPPDAGRPRGREW